MGAPACEDDLVRGSRRMARRDRARALGVQIAPLTRGDLDDLGAVGPSAFAGDQGQLHARSLLGVGDGRPLEGPPAQGPFREPVLKTARPPDAASHAVCRRARGSAVPSESPWCSVEDGPGSIFLPSGSKSAESDLHFAAVTAYVYAFADGSSDMRDVLGGKGAELAEMTSIGLPVPDGFTVTTGACRAYLAGGGAWPDGLSDEVSRHLAALEERCGGRSLGDPDDPLLVSVRSGSPVSMPGMMDTILNLGLNPRSVEGLARASGNERFAADSYRRFVQMYSNVVLGVPSDLFEDALTRAKSSRGVHADVDLDASALRELVEEFLSISREQTGRDFPEDPREQLDGAITAVFASWNTPRARTYRRHEDISDDLGTAVNIMQMVYGNLGDDSATGVVFTRNPSTGERVLYGEFLLNAQGEDVVAGIRTPRPIGEMQGEMDEAFSELAGAMATLETHYRDLQDVEFTVE